MKVAVCGTFVLVELEGTNGESVVLLKYAR